MKKLVMLLVLSLSLVSCKDSFNNYKTLPNDRIKEVESKVMGGVDITIISIDGKEYLINSQGGIQPLSK